MTKKRTMTNAECVERLTTIGQLFANPPEFKPGDILMINPIFVEKDDLDAAVRSGVSPLIVVLEVVESIRSVNTPQGHSVALDYDGPGFLGADIRTGGTGIDMNWFAAWMYVIAPAEYTTDGPVGTNH